MWLDIGAKSRRYNQSPRYYCEKMTRHSLQRQRTGRDCIHKKYMGCEDETLYFSKTVRRWQRKVITLRTRILTRVARIKEPLGLKLLY